MKTFIEAHETVIDYYCTPTIYAIKDQIVPHERIVSNVYFYKKTHIDGQEIYLRIDITKEMIFDLADSIKNIESKIVEIPYDDKI